VKNGVSIVIRVFRKTCVQDAYCCVSAIFTDDTICD